MERSQTHQFLYHTGAKRPKNRDASTQAKIDIMESEERYWVGDEYKVRQYCNIPSIIVFTDKL